MAAARQASFFAGAAARLQWRKDLSTVSRDAAGPEVTLPEFVAAAVPELLLEDDDLADEVAGSTDDPLADEGDEVDVGACLEALGLTEEAAADAAEALRTEEEDELDALAALQRQADAEAERGRMWAAVAQSTPRPREKAVHRPPCSKTVRLLRSATRFWRLWLAKSSTELDEAGPSWEQARRTFARVLSGTGAACVRARS